MLAIDLRNLTLNVPFRPFRIHLVTGQSYIIPHRDFLWTAPNSRSAVSIGLETGEIVLINTGLVSVVEYLPESDSRPPIASS